jgi:hypothetical protein
MKVYKVKHLFAYTNAVTMYLLSSIFAILYLYRIKEEFLLWRVKRSWKFHNFLLQRDIFENKYIYSLCQKIYKFIKS